MHTASGMHDLSGEKPANFRSDVQGAPSEGMTGRRRAVGRGAAATASAMAADLRTTGRVGALATAAAAAALQTHTGPTGAGRAMPALGEHAPHLQIHPSGCLAEPMLSWMRRCAGSFNCWGESNCTPDSLDA